MFPNIPHWYCMIYSMWICWESYRWNHPGNTSLWITIMVWSACMKQMLDIPYRESWVNPLPAEARQPRSGDQTKNTHLMGFFSYRPSAGADPWSVKFCLATKMFEQKSCFSLQMFEQKSCFALQNFEQKSCFAPKRWGEKSCIN